MKEATTGEMTTLDPSLQNPQDIYKLLGWGRGSAPHRVRFFDGCGGRTQSCPFQLFSVASANPSIACFCPMMRGATGTSLQPTKDTLCNIIATREFVVNIVSEEFATQLNACSAELPPEVDEFRVSGLTPLASDLVRPLCVAESHVQMKCRLQRVVHVSAGPLGGKLVLGEVLRFHVRKSLLNNFRIGPDKLHAIGRMAGFTYMRTRDRFDMERPK